MDSILQRTRIKMCGMTRVEDIQTACQLGADAVGLVFYPPSPRAVTLHNAEALAKSVTLMVDKVALFVNPEASFVNQVVEATGADILQFHGDETPDFCRQFNKRYIKALRVKDAQEIEPLIEQHKAADAILLDAFVKGVPGGTGERFDWSLVPPSVRPRLMLAGGLSSENVESAVKQVRPYAVDVSGGIEQSPGYKSHEKMAAFVKAVNTVDLSFSEISS